MKITRRQLRRLIEEQLTFSRRNRGGWERWLSEDDEDVEEEEGKEVGDDARSAMGGDTDTIPVETVDRSMLTSLIREIFLFERWTYDAHSHAEVVAAVDRALKILDISDENLRSLMIGIARTESGGSPKDSSSSEITGHDPDPFQLDAIGIKNTKENVNLRRWREWIDDKRGPNPANLTQPWESQSNSEIEGNIVLGALAATLYVLWTAKAWDPEKRDTYSFPSSVSGQASFWKTNYNTAKGKGTVEDYISKNS